jgi:hypothetical protein
MSRQHDNWVHQQLEPDLVLGNHKKYNGPRSTMFQKRDLFDNLKKELGEKEFARMEAEWQKHLETRFDD